MRLWEAIYKTVALFRPAERPAAALAALLIVCATIVAGLFLIAIGASEASPMLSGVIRSALR